MSLDDKTRTEIEAAAFRLVYGMPYEEWKTRYQKEASESQQQALEKTGHRH